VKSLKWAKYGGQSACVKLLRSERNFGINVLS